ncbi:MAG: transcriptional regulator [Phenylobacterium sp. RIFCSPHIGHO2_01_FULL_69_31]|uniref:helix-turn-helix transcriptional regulator n=1 Tax=Phenylobacterium sp. RIFCSPHIGHO2_01_FULL_69_31 TaxID=1801944 RepID=UPI0008D4E813|nr:AlpA family phage regulatory protein [Phenylobacterium sp. RIFCSPHIGHO2_01_FULL_69_31]OHB28145.1 MAG: transcriptional regulator [Phenylobacterium sp. RIFCSPHIGHO2_01_FULL_69_31]
MRYGQQTSAALADFDRLPDAAFVRLPVVMALFACSDETVRRRVKAGAIPAPVKLGPRSTAWRVGDLRATLDQVAA